MVRLMLATAVASLCACSSQEAGPLPPANFVARSTEPLSIEVTYIANEGVLIAAGNEQVLIDGLHRLYEPEYAVLPDREQALIETAQPPFDGIDVILVSHSHRDHFDATAVRRHLEHNPSAVLVSSQQITDAVKQDAAGSAALARIMTITPEPGTSANLTAAGIPIRVFRVQHGWRRWRSLQNLGHLVTLGGKKILHVGDAEATVENFRSFNLDAEDIDVAILPGWFLSEGEGPEVVTRYIKPKQLVAVHLPATNFAPVVSRVLHTFPDATAFTTLLEKRRY